MFGALLILAAAGLLGFAVYREYKKTSPNDSVAVRVWTSIAAAVTAGAAYVVSLFQSSGAQ